MVFYLGTSNLIYDTVKKKFKRERKMELINISVFYVCSSLFEHNLSILLKIKLSIPKYTYIYIRFILY